jgi:hypothetical protein
VPEGPQRLGVDDLVVLVPSGIRIDREKVVGGKD